MPGSIDDQIRELVEATIKGFCKKVRGQGCRTVLADKMTAIAGRRVTASMLNSYTRQDDRAQRISAALVSILCEATGDYRLVEFLLPSSLRESLAIGKTVWERMQRERATRRTSK